jgi:hypothetical protein
MCICDVIKLDEFVGNYDFKIANYGVQFLLYCIISAAQPYPYLWNHKSNLYGIFSKLKLTIVLFIPLANLNLRVPDKRLI